MLIYMRLHVKHLDPVVHGWIAQHKAKCKFNNQEDTISSLIQLAMLDYPEKIRELENKLNQNKCEGCVNEHDDRNTDPCTLCNVDYYDDGSGE